MFFKEKTKPQCAPVRPIGSCHDCGHLIFKDEAQKIAADDGTRYFCMYDQKEYTRVEVPMYYLGFLGRRARGEGKEKYFKEFQTDEDGTPIGFVKAPKSKKK